MTASSTGVAGAPSIMQIADRTVLNYMVAVDANGNMSVLSRGMDAGGVVQSNRSGPDGAMALVSDGVLAAILIEMRIQTKLLLAIASGGTDNGDPDLDRKDADAMHLLDSYNLS